ncbi:hypothetical protein B5P43_03835 [Bacillus sp. SRB_336]|nr:hypothetical protein B5P43_03835 [Bacillus sp. SRB_336]
MAKLITDAGAIDLLCRTRQTAEQRLAQRLYLAFSEGVALRNLQTVGARVVQEMITYQDLPLKKVLGECQILDIFKIKRFASLDDIMAKSTRLTPSDIADIIYICGEWVLAGGGTKGGTWPANEVQGAYKVGVTPGQTVKNGNGWAARHAGEAQRAVWKQEPGGRYRGNWTAPMETHIAQRLGPASTPGIAGKRSLEGSTVLKLDRLFGLLRGADISGSTAEGASILERWGSDILHSAYYLLPLATLVYNAHHTVLEVALTLSLNRIIDYHVGFYTTLLPDGVPPELDAVVAALNDAESETSHFVVFFENSQPAGCLLFEQTWEKNILRQSRFGRAVDMLALAQQLPNFPSRSDVFDLIRTQALTLAPGLPSDPVVAKVKLTQ